MNTTSLLVYFRELLTDYTNITPSLGLYMHVGKILEREIYRVRIALLSSCGIYAINDDDLPEPEGPRVTLQSKIYMPTDSNNTYNFVGRILGPDGSTARCLQQCLGVKIMIRGRGSMRDRKREDANIGRPNWEHLNDKLHVLISVEDHENRAKARLSKATGYLNIFLKQSINDSDKEDKVKQMQLMELSIRKEIRTQPWFCNYGGLSDLGFTYTKANPIFSNLNGIHNLNYTCPQACSFYPSVTNWTPCTNQHYGSSFTHPSQHTILAHSTTVANPAHSTQQHNHLAHFGGHPPFQPAISPALLLGNIRTTNSFPFGTQHHQQSYSHTSGHPSSQCLGVSSVPCLPAALAISCMNYWPITASQIDHPCTPQEECHLECEPHIQQSVEATVSSHSLDPNLEDLVKGNIKVTYNPTFINNSEKPDEAQAPTTKSSHKSLKNHHLKDLKCKFKSQSLKTDVRSEQLNDSGPLLNNDGGSDNSVPYTSGNKNAQMSKRRYSQKHQRYTNTPNPLFNSNPMIGKFGSHSERIDHHRYGKLVETNCSTNDLVINSNLTTSPKLLNVGNMEHPFNEKVENNDPKMIRANVPTLMRTKSLTACSQAFSSTSDETEWPKLGTNSRKSTAPEINKKNMNGNNSKSDNNKIAPCPTNNEYNSSSTVAQGDANLSIKSNDHMNIHRSDI